MTNSLKQGFFQGFLLNFVSKIENQKHLQSVKDGMVSILPIIIVGSFCILPNAVVSLFPDLAFTQWLSEYMNFFTYPSAFTNGLLSVYSAFFIADSLANKYGISSKLVGINSVIVHVIVSAAVLDGQMTVAYLGAEGLFTSILSAFFVVEVTRVLYKYNIFFKLPESVPPMVADSFKALVPMSITLGLSGFLTMWLQTSHETTFPQVLMDFMAPAVKSMDTLPAMLIIVFLTQILWFFGLHGAAITSAVWAPFAISYGGANIANLASGAEVTHFFTFGFYYAMLQVTGSGLTLGLVILMMRSKSKSLKAMGKVSIVPSIFGINEPVIFGCPIILNPFLFVPFVFGPLVVTAFTYFSMSSGIVGMPIANPPSFLPPGIGAFIMTLDWKSVVVVFISLTFMTLFYYPFFKAMEQHELKKEELEKEFINQTQ